jgi:hypothetical protein
MRGRLCVLGLALVLSSCGALTDAIGSIGTSTLQAAVESCASEYSGYVDVLDNGKTISIDGNGEEKSGAPIQEIACILQAIPVPSYIIQRMEQTRAIDGIQRETFDGFDISWSYHPDDGVDIVIHQN